MPGERGCWPVLAAVFKTAGRGDELRRWVRLPRTLGVYTLTNKIVLRVDLKIYTVGSTFYFHQRRFVHE